MPSESDVRTCPCPVRDKWWCPRECPITGRPFFMWIEGQNGEGWVPTYGGPYDSFTIPEREIVDFSIMGAKAKLIKVSEYSHERFDHDEGAWVEGREGLGEVLISESDLVDLSEPDEPAARAADPAVAMLTGAVWLVWSNEHNAWWGPGNSGYYVDIASAGRYTLANAQNCVDARSKRQDGLPCEIMVPSPELTAALAATPGGVG